MMRKAKTMKIPAELADEIRNVKARSHNDMDAAEDLQGILCRLWGWDITTSLARDFIEAVNA